MKTVPISPTIARLIACIVTLFIVHGCGGSDPGPNTSASNQEEVKKLLTSNTWILGGVTVDGVDQTDKYSGLTLKFSSTQFTSSNGDPVWPNSGTWAFTDENANAFNRNDGTLVNILEAKANALKLQLTWDDTTLGSGRAVSISGQYTFSFVK